MAAADISKKRLMLIVLLIGIVLMAVKFVAYWLTHSNAILTDAVESIVNVLAGSFALFSIYYASKPKDEDHPYGHGKMEFFSSGFEGGMITLAGVGMVIKGATAFFKPEAVNSVDIGIYLTAATGLVNYIIGYILVKRGKAAHSDLMKASGKHLISDTVSSIGLIVGLSLVYFTHLVWIDYAMAIVFGLYITWSGFKILKESVTNLLDTADYQKLKQLIALLNDHRREKWIDMHNLRVLKYGPLLHVDCHVTLPWYDTLELSHAEVHAVETLVRENMDHDIEFFIHADPCIPTSCPICLVHDCPVRRADFVKKLQWNIDNVLPDKKHSL